ncbi:major facilitator superfamily domain-containing protein [Auriculariales sp. MPI-PUGE-AT-0066]|nr:major facilitator superfamily domain-containing protein [Auriculariales sp. MPI-PUGE-AT-0066]
MSTFPISDEPKLGEKAHHAQINHSPDTKQPIDSEGASIVAEFDQHATKRLLRKMDIRLIPFVALLYLLSFLDRTNIGNARLAKLEVDLHMVGLNYSTALAIFFPFYVLAGLPSNIMMERTRPSRWIPFITVTWGFICCMMGIVKNLDGLLAARAFLGIAQGGLFPGVSFYITMWYRRHECGLRMALFFSAATAAGAFGGVLARALIAMDGTAGRPGWAWIFIIEGVITVALGLVAFFAMQDYPETATFLTPEEKTEVERRLKADRNGLADEWDLLYVKQALTDWKIWVQMLINIGIYMPLYSISLFLPTIVRSLGYQDNTAQLMSAPPYLLACILCIAAGVVGDRIGQRGMIIATFNVIAMIGFILLVSSTNGTVKYIGTFFAAAGIYPNIPQAVAWTGNNIGGSTKRGIGIAMHVGFGNLAGIIAAFLYPVKDQPHYRPGNATHIGSLAMSTVLCMLMTVYLRRENARRDAKYHKKPSEYTDEEKEKERDRGDNASFFRYTL